MDHYAQSQRRYHKEGSNKGFSEGGVGKDPNQAGNSGPERGDNNRISEIAGNSLAATKSMKQWLLISKDKDKPSTGTNGADKNWAPSMTTATARHISSSRIRTPQGMPSCLMTFTVPALFWDHPYREI